MTKRTPEQKVYRVLTADAYMGYDDMELEESTKEELEELKVLAEEAIKLEIEKRAFIRDFKDKFTKGERKYIILDEDFEGFGEEEIRLSELAEGLLKHFIRYIIEDLTVRSLLGH